MFGLALQTLKFRMGGFLASFIALFFGALILTACGGLMETGIRTPVSSPEGEETAGRLISLSAVFGGIAVMVAVFVVGSTLAVLVHQRLREMALLRAIGCLPGQIRRMIVGEALVVSAGALALALPPGHYAGRWMLGQIAGSGVIAPGTAYRAGWIPMAAAAGTSLLSAVAAAFIASRRAALTRPADALAESLLPGRWLSAPRLVFALLCLGGGTALAVVTATVMPADVAASTAGPSAMLWAGGVALIAPGLTRVLTAVLRGPLRAAGLAGRLAMDNARARRVQVAGAVTPVMLATGLATALIYLQTSQGSGGDGVGAWVNYMLAGTIIGYAVISLVNTLIVAAAERRREFALQRLVGAGTGQIMGMMAVESLLVALIGVILGTGVALATLTPFTLALDGSYLPHGPVWIYLAVIGFVGTLTMAATLLPTRYALRARPADAVRVF